MIEETIITRIRDYLESINDVDIADYELTLTLITKTNKQVTLIDKRGMF